jgi:molybdopterin/thiamine biosynthesis adenylyltransferase
MIHLTLTLNKEMIHSLVETIFYSKQKIVSFVYFRVDDTFYFFPSNNHSASLTGDSGFLTQINCNLLSIKDEVEKLLEIQSPDVTASAPLIWEIETASLLKYKIKLSVNTDFSDLKDFLETLLRSSRFFLNMEGLSLINESFQDLLPMFLYADENTYYKIGLAKQEDDTNKMQERTLLWLGEKNFNIIRSFRIGCVGAGGLMNPFIIQAMHHGFKNFIIIDHDRLEEHNLNRFLGAKLKNVGSYKTDILKNNLLIYDPSIKIETSNISFPEEGTEKLLSTCDMIVCGVDNDYTRVNVQLLALTLTKPLLDMGSGIFLLNNTSLFPQVDERGGQIRLSIPGNGCLVCMGLNLSAVKDFKQEGFDRIRGYIVGTDLTPPSIITLNSTIASIALKMFVDYITGVHLSTKHIKYNEKDLKLFHVLVKRNENCPVCQ